MNKLPLPRLDLQMWLLIGFSVLVWGPLLHPAYFFEAHDARHSIFYLVEFDQTFRDGFLYPRWSPDFAFGYGYPLFNIYAPLALYLAEFFHLLGLSMVGAVKTVYIIATLGAGLGMYGFVRRLFGANAGLLAGLTYMFAPFHLVELYVRSAFAEYVALMWLPLILWAFTELIARPGTRRLALAGLSYGLLALTHHTTLFTFTPFLMAYIVVLVAGKAQLNLGQWLRLALLNASAGLLGVLLAAIYLLPVLFEQQYIKVEQWTSGSYNFEQHFVYFFQLLSPFWGYGYAGPGPIDFMPYQVGIVIFGLAIITLVGLIQHGGNLPHKGTLVIFVMASIITAWAMSPIAVGLWQLLPIAALVQFPWRLLIILSLTLSVVVGGVVKLYPLEPSTVTVLAAIIALGSYAYAQPQYTAIPDWAETPLAIINWDSESVVDRVGMVVYTEEQPTTSPMAAQYRAGEPLQVAAALSPGLAVTTLRHGGASDEIAVQGDGGIVQFYTYDFPGWQVTLNGEPLAHRHEPPHGLITVNVPPGEHQLTLRMGATPPRTIGTILSLLALGLIVTGWVANRKLEP